jgi:hypothetical protein
MRRQFAQSDGLPFAEVLSAGMVMQALERAGYQDHDEIYTADVVLWTFLSQVLDADQSCRAAVMRVVAHRQRQGLKPCSSQTGAYCIARKRMPESVFAECVRQTALAQEAQAPADWKWFGRPVKIVDGTTVSMPDTPDNQAAYPQPSSQRPGLGFPLVRVLGVFSLATGMILDLRFARFAGKHQSELGMFREVLDTFSPGDVVLTDRYFCSWFEIALSIQHGIDVVMRLHQSRTADFRRGRRLGTGDHLVAWPKPAKRPDWMDQATYDALPNQLVIREVRRRVPVPGYRSREVVVATTLTDAEAFPSDEIAALYAARWHAELDLRAIKSQLQMDVVRGHSPDIVRKEIWVHVLAYNLIRAVMAQTARRHERLPRTLSFKAALQAVKAFQPNLATATPDELPRLCEALWQAIAEHTVGNRPRRIEPRARKRRPKSMKFLTQPRAILRKTLCEHR